MQFKEIIGQNELKQSLIKTVTDKRISHAQLFVGTEGSGNLALALAYAQYICCEQKQSDDSCGQCKSCVKFQKLVHPDLHFAFPVNTTKKIKKDPVSNNFIQDWRKIVLEFPYFSERDWYNYIGIENKQGNIGKLEADAIQHALSFKPYEADYQFMLIWLPERMNITAANKLLKLIEEPPANTIFLMVSKNIDLIIKTILSRTQLIRVNPIDEKSMSEFLDKKYNLSPHENIVLTRLSAGDILTALNIYDKHETEQDFFEEFKSIMRFSYARNFTAMLDWAEDIARLGREQQKGFLFFLQKMIRENFITNRQLNNIAYSTEDEKAFAAQFSKFISPNNVNELYAAINLALMHIEQNGNQKIIFTDLAIIFARLLYKA